jgi:hypothetical protein
VFTDAALGAIPNNEHPWNYVIDATVKPASEPHEPP